MGQFFQATMSLSPGTRFGHDGETAAAETAHTENDVTPLVVALVCLVLATPLAAQEEEPSLGPLLARVTAYVDEFYTQLSGMVAEERYEQRSRTPELSLRGGFPGNSNLHRVLRSDFLLVRPEGEEEYVGFRDVFEVDGQPVRDRQDRLTRLFLEPSASAEWQILEIRDDSARYNIGNVERNINVPTVALLFLRSRYAPQVEFELTADTSPRLGLDRPEGAADLLVVQFEEGEGPTLIRGRGGRDFPAAGRFWIEPETGRVFGSELRLFDTSVDITISVVYGAVDTMGHLVPIEMRERYDIRRSRSRVEGTAMYSHFRRFQVQVDETENTQK